MKVSILLCVYNSDVSLLSEVIKSIDNQTYKEYEVLIINDGTTDINTIKYLDELRGKQGYTVYDNKQNLGLIDSLNLGIDMCNGEYIARFDDDDISSEIRLERQVQFLDENKNISVLGAHAEIVNSDLLRTTTKKFPSSKDIKKYLPYRCPVSHSLVMFRRKDVINAGKYESIYKGCEDYALWLNMISKGYELDNLQEVLGKTKFTVEDANKRSKNIRKNLFKAKLKYLPKSKLYGIKGIIFSMIWSMIPQIFINKIYSKDINSAILLNR